MKVTELLDDRFNKHDRRMCGPVKVYDICAEDFLNFAMEDSKGQDLRSWVNALGNVKRAIECRIDCLLYNYLLHEKSEKERWDFPKKIEVISQLGIVAPRILRKINKKRNELEHRYVKPTQEDVDDALDVATLFLAYSDGLANEPTKEYGVGGDFAIQLNHIKGFVKLTDHKNNVEKTVKVDTDDGWIEFAKKLSGLGKPASILFRKTPT